MDPTAFWTTCEQNGLSISDNQIRLLTEYSARLLEWNKAVNLISRRDEDNFWIRHILHALGLLFKLDIPVGSTILDLGTGGGLPGIVLKIVRPDISFTLLDATQKKIKVVKDILGFLSLSDIEAIWGRSEDLGKQQEHAGRYDFVVARAVAPLDDLVRWSYPFLLKSKSGSDRDVIDQPNDRKKKIGGSALIAYKGGSLDEEIRHARNQPSVSTISTIDLTLSGSTQLDDNDKKLVIVEFVQS